MPVTCDFDDAIGRGRADGPDRRNAHVDSQSQIDRIKCLTALIEKIRICVFQLEILRLHP
jgi:hypothetical protein